MYSDAPLQVDITTVLPLGFDLRDCCNSRGYWRFEQRVVAYLKSIGWTISAEKTCRRVSVDPYTGNLITNIWPRNGESFVTTDGDSFGPLVRVLFDAIRPDGVNVDLIHG